MPRLLTLLFAALLLPTGTHAVELPQTVQEALHQAHIPVGSIGVVVRELGSNSPLIEVNASRPMNPASTMKLLTTYAALELLGPAYSWKTEAWLDGKLDNGVLHGNLVIKGHGDPKITVEQLWMWLHELRNRGLREVEGDLILDRSAFEAQPSDPGAFDNDPLRAYNVAPDALLVNFNAIRLHFVPGDSREVQVFTEPDLAGYSVDNRVVRKGRYRCSDWDDHLQVTLQGATIQVRGNYPVNCGEHDKAVSLLPHARYFDALFRAVWQEVGGSIRGGTRESSTPETATLFSTHYSQPLSELIRDINKYSNNVMARQLFLSLGANNSSPVPSMDLPDTEPTEPDAVVSGDTDAELPAAPGPSLAELIHPPVPASIARSEQAIRTWLASKELRFPELVLENGAGLSRRERISPLSMSQLLYTAQQSPLSAELEASLPIVGVDGTLKRRLDNCPATTHAHLKTGSLEGVKSIAGYVNSRSGKQWVVVFLINHPHASAGQRAQDAMIEWVEQQ